MKLLGLIIFQNIGYYCSHYLMHHKFYSFHSFHHKFDRHIFSSIAFAVSIEEFLFAYITPLMIGSCVLYPNETTFILGTAFIAVFNLIIHTPSFKTQYYPSLLVSPDEHLEHHEKKTIHYAAPIFSIDKILLFLKNNFIFNKIMETFIQRYENGDVKSKIHVKNKGDIEYGRIQYFFFQWRHEIPNFIQKW